MKKIIFIMVLIAVLIIPSLIYAIPYDRDSLENQVSSIWIILKSHARIIDQLRNIDPTIINEGDIVNITQNNMVVEYAPQTDGPWTKESFINSGYRRTGYTYDGITTYVVEEIQFCWSDDNTMMFIKK